MEQIASAFCGRHDVLPQQRRPELDTGLEQQPSENFTFAGAKFTREMWLAVSKGA
jgi:hypothetical protein